MSKIIHVRVPVRIDLAGGTVDLWPIYLLLKNSQTINLGINLFVEAEVAPMANDEIFLKSVDQEKEITIFPKDLENDRLEIPPSLSIHFYLLQYFKQKYPEQNFAIKLISIAKSPVGAGLGGSSALNIALTTVLYCWANQISTVDPDKDGKTIIQIARDIESKVLQGPAGYQDYFAAFYGGLQKIEWQPEWHSRYEYSDEIKYELKDRILLFYSGQSRNSGINNWEIYQNIVNQNKKTIEKFQTINQATQELANALKSKDWKAVGEAIQKEWESRKKLSKSISTSKIDKAFEKAKKIGAKATKICGAGGGGCFFVYLEENNTELKNKIIEAIEAMEIQHLPFEVARCGIKHP